MRYIAVIISMCILLGVAGCASKSKAQSSPEELEAFRDLVEQRSFMIDVEWAKPLATRSMNAISQAGLFPLGSVLNRIDLGGTESYLRISGDSAMARFPYYGERQFPGTFNNVNTAIEFMGVPTEFELSPKKDGYQMNFVINNGNESFQVSALLLPSNITSITVGSSHRTFIQYYGRVSAYAEE